MREYSAENCVFISGHNNSLMLIFSCFRQLECALDMRALGYKVHYAIIDALQ